MRQPLDNKTGTPPGCLGNRRSKGPKRASQIWHSGFVGCLIYRSMTGQTRVRYRFLLRTRPVDATVEHCQRGHRPVPPTGTSGTVLAGRTDHRERCRAPARSAVLLVSELRSCARAPPHREVAGIGPMSDEANVVGH